MSDILRSQLTAILNSGSSCESVREEFCSIASKLFQTGVREDDMLLIVAKQVFGWSKPVVSGKQAIAPVQDLQELMATVLVGYGLPQDQAKVSAEVLVQADVRGVRSHGVNRLKPIYCDRIKQKILKPVSEMTVVKETATTAVIDGNLGVGLYIGPKCMEIAIKKAKEHGLGMVVCRNSTHYGFAGYYAMQAIEAGCIGLTGTQARPSVAPTFGVDPMLGTNPLVFGIPSNDEFPFILDCATSVQQRGKLELWEREGKATPVGCVVDRMGRERTDTPGILADLAKGVCALAPLGGVGADMGGYKGYGYCTAVELLCYCLQDNPLWGPELGGINKETGEKKPMPLGHFFIAINIENFIELSRFKALATTVLSGLRASTKEPGRDRIFTAGEVEFEAEKQVKTQGGVSLNESMVVELIGLCKELNIPIPAWLQ